MVIDEQLESKNDHVVHIYMTIKVKSITFSTLAHVPTNTTSIIENKERKKKIYMANYLTIHRRSVKYNVNRITFPSP